jgi:hypothetical protein
MISNVRTDSEEPLRMNASAASSAGELSNGPQMRDGTIPRDKGTCLRHGSPLTDNIP